MSIFETGHDNSPPKNKYMNNEQQNKKLNTASGRPYSENENTMSVGARGPL